MNIKSRPKKQKGVALIFALFTIAILFSISTTVVALSMHHRQDSQVLNYNDAALQAANWGIEAALNYMGQPGAEFVPSNGTFNSAQGGTQWEYDALDNYESYKLIERDGTVAGGDVQVRVKRLTDRDLKKFGLDYERGESLGQSDNKWEERDSWKDDDSRVITFGSGRSGISSTDASSITYPLMYPAADGSSEAAYGVVNVVCTEIRTMNQPSTYELVAVSNIYQWDNKNGARYASLDETVVSDEADNKEEILASRVVSTKVRQMMASDFMHFIQNARSWDATGVDLWENGVARDRVFIPEGYRENGRLRVDGYDTKRNPEHNALKKMLGQMGLDGGLSFLYGKGEHDINTDRYAFTGDVTTMRGADSFRIQEIGNANSNRELDGKTAMFTGQLRDSTPSLGLPEVENYLSETVPKKADSKFTFKIGAGNEPKGMAFASEGSWSKTGNWPSSNVNNKCPDVAQAGVWRESGEGDTEMVGSATPTFATVRVEIKGNEVRVMKYNAAMTNNGQLLGTYQDPNTCQQDNSLARNETWLESEYIDQLVPWTSIDKVPNGIISVQGGNVEVVNVATKGSASSLSEEYIDAEDNGNNSFMNGALTIVADVEPTREAAVGDLQDSQGASPGNGGIYSEAARRHWEEGPFTNIPPFSARDLGIGDSTDKVYWPSPANSAIEREGNVIIGSDLRQAAAGGDGTQALGIVAKNYVYLNDKGGAKDGGQGLNELVVDGVLMSIDHSVQMDWNNMGGNKYHSDLILKRRDPKTLVPYPVADTVKDPTDRTQRRFTLNGAIVSGFMDVEGDTTGAGYFDQKFSHDPNLLYNLPPNFPKWSLTQVTSEGCFMDFMVMEYKDHGAISNLGYDY